MKLIKGYDADGRLIVEDYGRGFGIRSSRIGGAIPLAYKGAETKVEAKRRLGREAYYRWAMTHSRKKHNPVDET